MKKQLLLLLFSIVSINLFAQHISEYYTFSRSYIGNYTYLYNGDIILENTNSDGGEITNVSIGFDFEYAGTTYSSLTIGVNGAITFTGNDVFGGNDLEGTTTNTTDIIAPLWDDLYFRSVDNAEIRTELWGTSPNRYFAIEWRNLSWWHAGSTVTFKLYFKETSNDIEMYYAGVEVEETGGEIGASIGLNAGTSGDNFISVTPATTTTTSTSVANNAIMPSEYNDYVNGRKYTFKYGPHNDACEDAIVIIPNIYGYTNTQIMNGTDNNDGFIGCGGGMNDGVWYTYTPDYDGEITIDVTATDFDVELGVYTGSCGNFTCAGSADDGLSGEIETVVLDVVAGTQYWINAGHFASAIDVQETGNLTINLNFSPPANDLCTDAIEISCGDTLDGVTVGATATGETTCGLYAPDKGVWYHFAPTNGGGITSISTTADFDSKLAVYSGSCTTLSCIANDDNSVGNQPYIEIETLPETDYYIYVAGITNYTGEFSLNVECTPPANDESNGAIDIPVNTIGTTCANPTMLWNNNGVTDSSPINGTPSCGIYAGGDSWYKFTAPASGGIRINRPNPGAWGYLGYAIYDSPNANTPLVCGYIGVSETTSSSYTGMISGNTYWLRVWEYENNNFGSVGICLEEVDTAGYDDLAVVNFNYYPNPVTDVLHANAQEKITQITIYNLLGQEVKRIVPNALNTTIDLSNLSNGAYFIKAQVGTHIGTYKIIKK